MIDERPFPPGLTEPPRISLGRLSTPLEPLPRTSAELGMEVWVKRDDLTGVALSGNKVRKLEYLAADAVERKAQTLITCGGVNSNHARTTAVAAARIGVNCHLLLRGEDRRPPVGNLLLDRWFGAKTTFVDATAYQERHRLLRAIAESEGQAYIIDEGGSDGLGAMGYVRAGLELLEEAAVRGVRVARVVHALGSGGTTAGLALAFSARAPAIDLVSVAVMKDAAHFDPIIRSIVKDAHERGFVAQEIAQRARWKIFEGFVGPGYAQTTPEALRELRAFSIREGLVVDPVYTGKALLALLRGALPPPKREGVTVFIHTGGVFELFAYANLVDQVTR